MKDLMPLVYIILLNYNGYKYTVECIESLEKVTYNNYKVVIVDNNSTDGSQELIRKNLPEYTFIETGKNLGFAGGNNIGIEYALTNGAEYVLLLNNDTIVEPDFINCLVETAEKNTEVGVVGGKIYYYDDKKLWYAGARINSFTGKTQHIGDREDDIGQYDRICETGYITGCLMLISRKVIEEVGLMDDKYFLYYEETDWNVRIKKAGYKIIYNPNSKIYHKVSATTKGINNVMKYYYDRNVYYFIRKNFNLSNRIFMYAYMRCKLALKLVKAMLKRDKKKVSMILRTYKDISSGTMGEYV